MSTSNRLARFEAGSAPTAITGDRRQGSSRRCRLRGSVTCRVDDATRLAYVEVLAEAEGGQTVGFLPVPSDWFFLNRGSTVAGSSRTTAPLLSLG